MSRHLDRALQRRILETLADVYPLGSYDMATTLAGPTDDAAPLEIPAVVNTQYLAEHGLVVSGYVRRGTLDDDSFLPARETTITAAGLDFLAGDGGLGAILGVVTVRLEAKTLEALLAARIDASDLPAPEKSRLKATLGSLSREALHEATRRLVSEGLDRWPEALAWLQKLPG